MQWVGPLRFRTTPGSKQSSITSLLVFFRALAPPNWRARSDDRSRRSVDSKQVAALCRRHRSRCRSVGRAESPAMSLLFVRIHQQCLLLRPRPKHSICRGMRNDTRMSWAAFLRKHRGRSRFSFYRADAQKAPIRHSGVSKRRGRTILLALGDGGFQLPASAACL